MVATIPIYRFFVVLIRLVAPGFMLPSLRIFFERNFPNIGANKIPPIKYPIIESKIIVTINHSK
jgi:hypothetical protein